MNEEQKNRDFVQFYRPFLDDITKLAREQSTAYDLFMFLCKYMDGGNALCISNASLSYLLNVTTRTIQRAVKYLRENGWVCVLKSGTSNVYVINPDVAWTSYSNQKQYCKFSSNVILTANENNEFLNNRDAMTKFRSIDKYFLESIRKKHEEWSNECDEYQNLYNDLEKEVELSEN